MKQEKVRIFKELLITQMNYLVLFPLGLTLVTLFGKWIPPEKPNILIWMLAGLIPFGLYFVRRKIHHFVPLILVHMLCIGILWLLSQVYSPQGSPINRIYFMMIGMGFVIYSIYLRLNTKEFEDKAFAILFSVGAIALPLFVQHCCNDNTWDSYYVTLMIWVLTYYFLINYVSNFLNFLKANASSAGILPEQEIYHSGMRLTAFYTLAGVIVLIFTAHFNWLQNMIFAIIRVFILLLNFIACLFPTNESAEIEIMDDSVNRNNFMDTLPESAETASFWQFSETVIVFVVAIGLVIGIVIGLSHLFSFIKEMMQNRGGLAREAITSNSVDVREKLEIRKSTSAKAKSAGFFGFLDSKERIRRIYKNAVKKEFEPKRLPYLTAREMEQEIERGAFAEIYEKARYSNEECKAQDVKLMKAACK